MFGGLAGALFNNINFTLCVWRRDKMPIKTSEQKFQKNAEA